MTIAQVKSDPWPVHFTIGAVKDGLFLQPPTGLYQIASEACADIEVEYLSFANHKVADLLAKHSPLPGKDMQLFPTPPLHQQRI
ncbi:hypothetical protein V6N11_003303 [Hibiscus sabdariffa]|uniref:Uncharacterized protein n=1 Tax=Hibiscus sabdariffa TaxID=183260 RepID=A0ABR2SD13_9ROSI